MLLLRTILLWLCFILLILQYFIEIKDPVLGPIFRLSANGILLIWILLSVVMREKRVLKPGKLTKTKTMLFHVMRPFSILSIVLGAILKIMHWPFSEALLVAGIGFMAAYSTILYRISAPKEAYDPDIVDDIEE